ncbi:MULTISPECIES: copper transporter [unclassified Halobacillus]|uniref:copper resistance D family protein n=1 Tax=unclassified Halobacillus TaxID=2636472 RepID=UPI0002A512CA|nr:MULTISPECIES: copper transporter [unclassified Halobacillus]ELK46393.1 copper export protein-like protein [Halobacillus sp. BAB-2008]
MMEITLFAAEVALYISFSLLIGGLLLLLIAETSKPPMVIPNKLIITASMLTIAAAFLPILPVTRTLARVDTWQQAFMNVLFTFSIGKSFLFITLFGVLLLLIWTIKGAAENKYLVSLSLALVIAMIISYTQSSHTTSLAGWQGQMAHTIHFLAVSLWLGILFIVSWLSKGTENWSAFLRWFTPTAIAALLIVTVSGFFTMSIDLHAYGNTNLGTVQAYEDGLASSYGQGLLWKHLFFLAIIMFAVINGILFRRKREDQTFNPFPWTKAESLFALIAFLWTSYMGRVGIPSQGGTPAADASFLYSVFTDKQESGIVDVTFAFGPMSWLLLLLGTLFLLLALVTAVKKSSVSMTATAGAAMIITFYLGVMTGVQ